jgi:DNA-binding transcriptional MerR regulator/methylmalonyl-CoA mutase cobalamin-binding subunit
MLSTFVQDKMNDTLLPIAAVERDTGIGKDTLRVWERRYQFPTPVRDAKGERLYPAEQVARLRVIRRLIDLGHRPGKIVGASDAALAELIARDQAEAPPPGQADDFTPLIDQIKLRQCDALRLALQQRLLRQGLQGFIVGTLAPLNERVGLAWFDGTLGVSEEHMYTEQVKNLIRSALGPQLNPLGSPRVLLTTFPEESHGLGLLMVEGMLVPEGVHCVSLGTRTPLVDIARAASEGGFDIVALSFSSAYPGRQAVDGLRSLRELLDGDIEIWAGGKGAPSRRRDLDGVTLIDRIEACLEALATWRASHHDAR